ncbi:MAG: acetyl-CoA carboxylase biotin carboxylase subunit, partial [Candidatus Poseidoniia archaeon]|nr:acetyl-CoA carboxylase biotin carboxylase subunit [Candidatus Poseidoniia archaeon]
LEMNTRLQVEHGVTEMVCGIDLVKWQIRVANGEELSISQKDVKQTGHSIECRIYAEDPSRNFLPTPGHVRRLNLPVGPGIRNDVGIVEGQEVSSSYDPLLSKLVVWDSNRADAINRMNYALSNFVVLGLITNQPFLKDVISNKEFIKGNFDTNFISENFADWKLSDIPLEAIASALLSSKNSTSSILSNDDKVVSSPWSQKGHWRQGIQ